MKIVDLFSKNSTVEEDSVVSDGTYVAVLPTEESKQMLNSIVGDFTDDPIDSEDFHVTILYSRVKLDLAHGVFDLPKSAKAIITGIEEFGEGTIVFTLLFDYAVRKHNEYIRMGGTHDYDSYKPHLTISYDGEILSESIEDLPPIEFDKILIEELNTGEEVEEAAGFTDIPDEPIPRGPFFHGTSSEVDIDDRLIPPHMTGTISEIGRKKNLDLVFFTSDVGSAEIYAGRAVRVFGGEPVIYLVYPVGDVRVVNETPGTTVYAAPWAYVEKFK